MRRLVQHCIILTDKFTSHTLWVWTTISNHFYRLIFKYSKVVEHQNLTKKPKYIKHLNIKYIQFVEKTTTINQDFQVNFCFYYYYKEKSLFQIDEYRNVGSYLTILNP